MERKKVEDMDLEAGALEVLLENALDEMDGDE